MYRACYVYLLNDILVDFAYDVFALISGQLFALSSDDQVTHADIYKSQRIYYRTCEFGT